MFNFHTAFSLALIALALGGAVLILSKAYENVGTTLAKIIAYIVIVVAIPNVLCTSYYAVKYRVDGYFDKPFPPMMMPGQMMQNMKGAMMSEQMPNNAVEHKEHHK